MLSENGTGSKKISVRNTEEKEKESRVSNQEYLQREDGHLPPSLFADSHRESQSFIVFQIPACR